MADVEQKQTMPGTTDAVGMGEIPEKTEPDPVGTAPMSEPSQPKESFLSQLFDYIEILIFAICIVFVGFTLFGRLCRVDGNSMMTTLHNDERLVTSNLSSLHPGDIVVFHQTNENPDKRNEPLVKRIIAMGGQTVRIDYKTGTVSVDGQILEEPYMSLLNRDLANGEFHRFDRWVLYPDHDYNHVTGIFEVTVPEGCLFVMGDNRNYSLDSRFREIGFVDERRVLGKVILRVRPWTKFS